MSLVLGGGTGLLSLSVDEALSMLPIKVLLTKQ
jgi:hypothetical protein